MKRACPRCRNSGRFRVLYAGLPLWLCSDPDCHCVWGFWSSLFFMLPFNGAFFVYEPGRPFAYARALVAWLRGEGQ